MLTVDAEGNTSWEEVSTGISIPVLTVNNTTESVVTLTFSRGYPLSRNDTDYGIFDTNDNIVRTTPCSPGNTVFAVCPSYRPSGRNRTYYITLVADDGLLESSTFEIDENSAHIFANHAMSVEGLPRALDLTILPNTK